MPRKDTIGLLTITLKLLVPVNGTSLVLLIMVQRSYLNMPLTLISNDTSLSMVKLTHTVHYGTSTIGVDMPGEWPLDFCIAG
jgi:hypothetical protein